MNCQSNVYRVAILCGVLWGSLLVISSPAQQIAVKPFKKPALKIHKLQQPPVLKAQPLVAPEPSAAMAKKQPPQPQRSGNLLLRANPMLREATGMRLGGTAKKRGPTAKGPGDSGGDDTRRELPGPSIRVLYPNGGETLSPGSICEVRWQTTGSVRTPTISILRGGTPVRTYDSSRVFGTRTSAGWRWSWTVPGDLPAGSNYQVRLEARATDPMGMRPYVNVSDTSDRNFSIAGRSLVVRGPRAGDTVYLTNEVLLSWNSYGSTSNVNVFLYRAASGRVAERALQMLWGSAPHSDRRRWIVGMAEGLGADTVLEPGRYFIRVVSTRDASLHADTPVFSIARPELRVTDPNGGGTIRGYRSYTVRWSCRRLSGTVNIELWAGSVKLKDVATDVRPGSFSYTSTWFPDPPFGTGSISYNYSAVKVRIVSTRVPYIFDESDGTFRVENIH